MEKGGGLFLKITKKDSPVSSPRLVIFRQSTGRPMLRRGVGEGADKPFLARALICMGLGEGLVRKK